MDTAVSKNVSYGISLGIFLLLIITVTFFRVRSGWGHFASPLAGSGILNAAPGRGWGGLTQLLLHKTTSASTAQAGRAQSSPRDPGFPSREGGRGRPRCPKSPLYTHPPLPATGRPRARGGRWGCSGHRGVFLCLRGVGAAQRGGEAQGSDVLGGLSAKSWIRSCPRQGRGGSGRQGAASLSPPRSGMGGGTGKQPAAGQPGVRFAGAPVPWS